MALDPNPEVKSPTWWFQRLLTKLVARRPHIDRLDSYYDCENAIPIAANRALKDSYRRLMWLARTNFAELVVEAVRERMRPTGFRTGADSDPLGDQAAWDIWQANALDADSALVHRTLLTQGIAYVIVGGPDADTGAPLITPEDPREVIVECDAVRRRKSIAALKVYADDLDGEWEAFLYLPGEVFNLTKRADGLSPLTADLTGWAFADPASAELPANVVPVVEFPNRDKLWGHSRGEFEPHLPVLDRINYSILERLEIATLQAFRQRAIKGIPIHDAQGNQIDYSDVFAADPGALWQLPEAAEIWESGQVDLGPIRQAIRDDVQDLAAVTRTPLFYLTPDAANGSAEGAALAREGLVFKVTDRLTQVGESWEQVMSLAFLFAEDETRASRRDMEIIWASPERFSLAERADAATKLAAAGVPWRTIMTDVLQFSPQEVERMESERAADVLLAPEPTLPAASGTPATTPAPVNG